MHHLCTSREWFLLLRQFLHNLTEINDFFRLNTLWRELVLSTKEGFSCGAELREAIVYHLLRAININGPHLMELIDPFLGYPFIEMLLL